MRIRNKHWNRMGAAALAVAVSLSSMASALPTLAQDQSFDPATFSLNLELVIEGLNQPVQIVDANDESGRMFIVEQGGLIRILRDGVLLDTPLLDISDQVTSGSEQGLLSMALHPNFAENGLLFIDYTDTSGNTQIERWTVRADSADEADPASAETLLTVEQPYPNHNGGLLMFGPDSYLYVGLGDGGSGGDPEGNAQNLGVLLGKILRIDIDHTMDDLAYSIPADNPFVGRDDARGEIWLYGLRNPWRFSFDRETGDMIVADVGQGEFEEATLVPAGEGGLNLGWDIMEGTACYEIADCDPLLFTGPFFIYSHSAGFGCSITGGYVYRGESIPSLTGAYLAADYCSGYVWAVDPTTGAASDPQESGLSISSFGEDATGELYIVSLDGSVFRMIA